MTIATVPPPAPGETAPPPKKRSTLKRRLITGGILSALTLVLIWSGVVPFACQVVLLAMIGLQEYFALAEKKGYRPAKRMGTLSALLVLLSATFLPEATMSRVIMVSIIAICITAVLRFGVRTSTFLDGAITVYGIVYLAWMFGYLILIRRLDHGAALVTMLVVASAFTDMGGFFVGKKFGRIKLFPSVSPNKTVEGAMGGILFPIAACYFTGWLVGVAPIHRFFTAVLVGVTGQLGDLWESALKRDVGVKDSGTAIGAHGGALDRFDSLSFAAPLYYLYAIGFIL